MSRKIRIVIADDELLFRQGIQAIFEKESMFTVLYGAQNGEELLEKLQKNIEKPDIVITDLNMPVLNGVETTKQIVQNYPEIKVIALTSHFSKPFIINMISIGAVGYLAKNSTPQLMIDTIKKVFEFGFYYNQQVLTYIQEGILNSDKKKTKSTYDSHFLTKREKEVLELICREYSTNEIAEKLFISPRTVEGHRNNLILKTGVKNIAGLVIFALTNKLVSINLFGF